MSDRLAIDGGTPVVDYPLAPWPQLDTEEVARASAVLESGRLNYWSGGRGKAFEAAFGDRHGARAIAMANGTVTLEAALRALGIGSGDEVVVPAKTFIATAAAVHNVGGRPVVCDVDRDSGNMTAQTVDAVLTDRTRAIIPVHLGGWPVDMRPILELAARRDLHVIEDCAQAIGAFVGDDPVGILGDFGSFSFCHDKIMTTGGEGGALVTRDEALWERAWSYKDHGKVPELVLGEQGQGGALFKWVHGSFGSNFRMTEVQAELGLCALERLSGYLDQRRANALALRDALTEVSALAIPLPDAGFTHAFYRLNAMVVEEALAPGWDRDRVIRALRAEGVPCSQGVCSEIHREAAFENAGARPDYDLPVAAELTRISLSFLVHPTMGTQDMERAAAAVRKVFAHAS